MRKLPLAQTAQGGIRIPMNRIIINRWAVCFALALSGALAEGFCAQLILSQSPPNIILEEDRYTRVEITALADQPTLGSLVVALTVQGPAASPPTVTILEFGSVNPQTGEIHPTFKASDFLYILPSGSTGSIRVTASAEGFSPGSASIDVQNKDSDSDGVPDFRDICPKTYDPRQYDADDDGVGDACDPDTDVDQDGVNDTKDNCPALANPDQSDSDRDGYGDACDNYPQNTKKD